MRTTLFPMSLLLLLAGCPNDEPTPTEPEPTTCTDLVADDIDAGGTLAGCYNVTEGIYLTGDVVIEAGSELIFAPGTWLQVGDTGSLDAQGTADAPITLRGETDATDTWVGVGFTGSGSPSNRLAHTTVSGACQDRWNGANDSWGAVYTEYGSRLTLESVTIDGCTETGFQAFDRDDVLSVDGLSVTGADIGVRIAVEQAPDLGGTITIDGDDPTVHLNDPSVDTDTSLPMLDYTLERGVYVSGADLVIPAGATLSFAFDTGLDVQGGGSVNAVGTETAPIVLQGVEDVDASWYGVHLENSNSGDNELTWVTIDGGGSDFWHGGDRSKAGLYLEGDEVRMTADHLTVTRCEGPGITIDAGDPAGKIAIHTARVSGCDEGARVTPDGVGALLGPLTITENDDDHLRVSELVPGSRDASEDITWLAHDVPWFIDLSVRVTGEVTIAAGAELVFDDDAGITVGDSITDPGDLTIGEAGGDTVVMRGDSAVAGFWRGLRFYGSQANSITNATISDAGSSRWSGAPESQAGIHITGGGSLAVADLTLSNIEYQDIYVSGDASLTGCTDLVADVDGDENASICAP